MLSGSFLKPIYLRRKALKREFPKFNKVITGMIFLGVFSCSFSLNMKAPSAQRNDSTAEPEALSSTGYSVSTDDQGTDTPPDANAKDKTSGNQSWAPPPPPPDDFDWIQLKSGEWLKGKLNFLYEKKLEFDSDELDLQKFDWEDVKQVRGHQFFSVRFEGAVTVNGLLHVTENKVFVTIGEERKEFERSTLIAIAPGKPKEINYWSAKIDLGLDLTKGNTDQLQYNTKWDIRRRTASNRFVFEYLGNFTQTEGVDTVDNQRAKGFFDIFVTKKYYIRPIFVEYFRDPFQNIESRSLVGTGIGYHIIDTSKTTWDVTPGLAYQYTRFVSVEPGDKSTASTPALAVGTYFDRELTKRLDFIAQYNFNIVNQESGRYTHYASATLEIEITTLLDIDISFVWNRTSNPQARADGAIPEKDDFQLILAVGVDL
jgi:hypothetical protein